MKFWFLGLLGVVSVWGAEADAVAIAQRVRDLHMPFGTVVSPIFASPQSQQVSGYTRCGDSALWTGYYLAAESLRFHVTGDEAALENVRAALRGVRLLATVSRRGLLARCAIPHESVYAGGIGREERANGVFSSELGGRSYYWIGNTSRDQYTGVFFGMSIAYDFVPDAQVRQEAASLITLLLDDLLDRAWILIFPDLQINAFTLRADQRLALLQIGRHVNPARFADAYSRASQAERAAVILPIQYDSFDEHNSYFKFNLNSANLFHLVRLSAGEDDNAYFRQAYDLHWRTVANHANAFFQMIDRALRGPDTARDNVTRILLEEWLRRPSRDYWTDLSGRFPSCGENRACDLIPVPLRVNSDFLWQRSPFQLYGGGSGRIEEPKIDYLLPYWLARRYGVVVD